MLLAEIIYMSEKMHFTARNLTVILLALSLLLISPMTATAKRSKTSASYTILVSKHKKAPGEPSAVTVPSRTGARYSTAKHRSKKRSQTITSKITASEFRKMLSSKSALIVDTKTGNTIYAHSPGRSGQPASTIKVLTGLIAIRYLENDAKIPVSRRASRMPSSKIYLEAGKSYLADDMINAVLLSSANDASVALAEKIAGSEKTFAKLMTHKAKAYGARNTVCKTSTGLTARGQKSTVRDLAAIFEKAMESQEFAKRMALVKTKTTYGKVLRNHNKALRSIDGAEGGKTGYTRAARQTYVGKFSRDGHEIVVALMGSETMWQDVKDLVEYGFAKMATNQDFRAASDKIAPHITSLMHSTLNQQQALLVISENKKVSLL